MNSEIEFRIKKVTEDCDNILFGTKDEDYNSFGVDILDYYPFPVEGIMHDINRKTKRLLSLLGSSTTPNNESIEDNFRDLINYSRIGYAIYKHFEVNKEMPGHTPDEKKKNRKKKKIK